MFRFLVSTAYSRIPVDFFSDVLVRWDWYSNDVTNLNVGLAGATFDAQGTSVTANAGYRFSLPNNWFVEPSGGMIWSRVSIDSLAVPGPGPFGVPPGTITFADVDSVLGRVGVRVGTTFTTPTLALQPFVAANLWHEFEGIPRSQALLARVAASRWI